MNNKSIIISIFVACVASHTAIFATESTVVQQQGGEITKPGLSATTPIIVLEKDIKKAEEFAEKYIKDNYFDYKIIFILMEDSMSDGHAIQKYTLQKIDRDDPEKTETVDLYFNIEIAMVEFRKKNAAEIRERLKHIKISQE